MLPVGDSNHRRQSLTVTNPSQVVDVVVCLVWLSPFHRRKNLPQARMMKSFLCHHHLPSLVRHNVAVAFSATSETVATAASMATEASRMAVAGVSRIATLPLLQKAQCLLHERQVPAVGVIHCLVGQYRHHHPHPHRSPSHIRPRLMTDVNCRCKRVGLSALTT